MSDELFPDKELEKKNDGNDESKVEELMDNIRPGSPLMRFRKKYNELMPENLERKDKITAFIVSVEAVLILYIILALMGILPFF